MADESSFNSAKYKKYDNNIGLNSNRMLLTSVLLTVCGASFMVLQNSKISGINGLVDVLNTTTDVIKKV